MKKIFFCALIFWAATFLHAATNVFPADDARITYVGRTFTENGTVSYDWTGTYVRISFEGTKLAIKASNKKVHRDAHPDSLRNYYNLYVDTEIQPYPAKIVAIQSVDTTITLFESKKKGKHTITLLKRTEGEQGTLTLKEILVDGVLLPAPAVKARLLEFIGDSYTCGYGSEITQKSDPFRPETESNSLTYASIIARYFNADYITIAHSGMGISRNYDSKCAGWHMPERYQQTFDIDSTHQWDAKTHGFKPNMTVIYIGGNDFSTALQPHFNAFKDQYLKLLREIKANYGDDYPILCATPKDRWDLAKYVEEVVTYCQMKNVFFLSVESSAHLSDDTELGASHHPNYNGHRKIAHIFVPHVATITGWGLQDKPIK